MIQLIYSNLKKDQFARFLDKRTLYHLAKSEDAAQRIENKYIAKSDELFEQVAGKTLEALADGKQPDMKAIEEMIGEMFFETAFKAIETARESVGKKKRLAFVVPKGFSDLKHWYDKWRKTGALPPKQKKLYEKVKKEYLKKCHSVWDEYGERYRTGETASRVEATQQIREAAQTTSSRAKTIVRTETTSGYNSTRKQYFDRAPDITHYLFLAIRDQRTTRWCTHKTIDGKRGRHGLVYAKGDPLCDKECPACHWNCRSTFVPLTPHNPFHLKMIENKSLARRNNECFPLPVGWSATQRAA